MRVAVVVPCYRETRGILAVLAAIGPEVDRVYVVDDACPDGTGRKVEAECDDPRVSVLYHETNRGVGAATLTGFAQAADDGADVLVKMDGDGQMDPARVPALIRPILEGWADAAKGNRFFDLEDLYGMPWVRKAGNAALSFCAKLSTGYWDLFDPANGFLAVHAAVAARLPVGKLSPRYFFESDLLFRLGTLRAVVVDVPMPARYGEETSHLVPQRVALPFLAGHARNLVKRIFYGYFLRDFSMASVHLLVGLGLLGFGVAFGALTWSAALASGRETPAGTVMLAALPTILGVQLLLSFLAYDVQNRPAVPLQKRL
jgi:glycosyltransferase involved in cell wall biosynthesis